MRTHAAIVAAAALVATACVPRFAAALGPVDLEAGARVGAGTSTLGSDKPNTLGLGVGGRAGISAFGYYGGLSGMYYFGAGKDVTENGTTGHQRGNSTLLGLEGGYNFGFANLTIRPLVGVGYYSAGFTGFDTHHSNSVYLQPAITGVLGFGVWFIGADADLLWVPAVTGSQIAVLVHGQIGIKL